MQVDKDNLPDAKLALTRLLQVGEYGAAVVGIEAIIEHKIAEMLEELSRRMEAIKK